jgi:hypothetical protein
MLLHSLTDCLLACGLQAEFYEARARTLLAAAKVRKSALESIVRPILGLFEAFLRSV